MIRSIYSVQTWGGQDIIGYNEHHNDCICEAGFEGSHSHCEYVVRMAPRIVTGASAADNGTYHPQEKSSWDMVVFVLLVLLIASIWCPCSNEEIGGAFHDTHSQ